jgi:magnesium transporter
LSSKIAKFYTDELLITIHRNELHFLNNIQKKVLGDSFGNTVSEVIIKILRDSIETFNDPGERLSEQVDFFETHIFLKDTPPDQLETLYYVKRKAALCSRLLTLSLEPINGIIATTETDAGLQDVKDRHLKMTTLYTQAQDDVTNLMNIYLSFSSQKTNEVMKVLTIFSVFFMPITFIVGIYGMNFQYMPELSKKWGYPFVLLTMALVTVIIYKWFKKKKWL